MKPIRPSAVVNLLIQSYGCQIDSSVTEDERRVYERLKKILDEEIDSQDIDISESVTSSLPIRPPSSSPIRDSDSKNSTPKLDNDECASNAISFEKIQSPTNAVSLDKLQAQLRHNVEKYMNENLNTMNISRCVRELLSVHNIGQRLFAKYVLGLSQGTVSELLSKPKPWDKLTEKGRDSYRKMHAWAADESCIYQLKSLVPRKGKDATMKPDVDPAAEERVQAILNEAQRSMITPRTNGGMPNRPPFPPTMMMGLNGFASSKIVDSSLKDDNSSENDENEHRLSPNPSSTAAAYINFQRLMSKKDAADNNSEMGVPSDIVARIYQEELAKIVGKTADESSFRSGHGMPFDRADEIRKALSIYQQEISRLSQLAATSLLHPSTNPEVFARFSAVTAAANLMNGAYLGIPPGSLMDPSSLSVSVDSKHIPTSQSSSDTGRFGSSSAFCLVRPTPSSKSTESTDEELPQQQQQVGKRLRPSPPTVPSSTVGGNVSASSTNETTTSSSGAEDLSSAASPLQRMQSITNSLLSQSSVPAPPSTPHRPAKAVLPPITQQQFDQYNNLNTEEIVRLVKEQLSQYSISQRLFGESVLGLSQGSVSDLLARPKPWHMLTQKGREPFIRMKMFLEDDGAVHKLVASQYKIAPEKLMRTGGFIAGPTGPPPPVSSTNPHLTMTSPLNALKVGMRPSIIDTLGKPNNSNNNNNINNNNNSISKNINEPRQTLSPTTFDDRRSTGSTPELSSQTPMAAMFASFQPQLHGLIPPSSILGNRPVGPLVTRMPNLSTPIKVSSSFSQPSVYEIAALTTDLDTQAVTTKIKETLMAHNIGQKIFGEVVLGLSQGSVSELLSKPKPWHMLSIKGREPFIRMQLWLSDPNNIEKLQTLKNERREANKRRRTNAEDGGIARPPSTHDSPIYNFNSNSGYNSPLSGNYGSNSPKKPRILFSEEQKEALKLAFSIDSYPTQSTIEFLANELGLSTRTITNWFHNHRMRLKQVSGSSDPDASVSPVAQYGINRESSTFDTVQFRILLAQRLAEVRARNIKQGQDKQRFGGLYGSLSGMFANSCSSPGSSIQGDDDAGSTLDLSVAGQNNKVSSPNPSLAEDSDQSRESLDDDMESDRSPPRPLPVRTGSSRRKPSFVTSSSSRRKAAQPKWINPGLEYSGDDDDDDAIDDRNGNESDGDVPSPDSRTSHDLINGVLQQSMPNDVTDLSPTNEDGQESIDGDRDDNREESIAAS